MLRFRGHTACCLHIMVNMYDYESLEKDIKKWKALGAAVESIGRSSAGREIYCIKTGFGGKSVIVHGAIHAREHISARLVSAQTDYYLNNPPAGTIYFIPMVNPDGVEICKSGFGEVLNPELAAALAGSGKDPRLFKANANGVDLNVNFDADWGYGEKNVHNAGCENYIGEYPESEPESRALADFTRLCRPSGTLSYHAKGEEIYWYFKQRGDIAERDLNIARKIADITGYPLILTPGSSGGYKDWCVSVFEIPSLTIEIGSDFCDYYSLYDSFTSIFTKNRLVPGVFLKNLY